MSENGHLYNGDARILKQVSYGPACRLIRLAVPSRISVSAGQFAHLLIEGERYIPLLRRPFSFWDAQPFDGKVTKVDLLYQIVGRGTALLEKREAGSTVGFLGPVGRGFSLRRDRGTFVFVAGGVGIVPFYLFAKQIRRSGHRARMILLFGARTKAALWGIDEFRALGVEACAATDDGSRGFKGFVTDLAEWQLEKLDAQDVMLYTCGPDPMLQRVVEIARRRGLPCEASLERRMGCALGACGACVTRVRDGRDWRYSRICIDGPAYDAADLVLGDATA